MSADTSLDISMKKISLNTKMNTPRCFFVPAQNSHTHISIDDSMDIPEVVEPEDPKEKDDTYMLLMLALRTPFVYKNHYKHGVKDEEDAAAGPSNWNQNGDSDNDSSVQVHDVSSSNMTSGHGHLEKKNSPEENQGITFSVEKYFLNNIKQDTPPFDHLADNTHDADTDMQIDAMTTVEEKNVLLNENTENIANTLQSYNYHALMPSCCLCKKSPCPIRDKYLGEKLIYPSISEPQQIIPGPLQPTLQEDITNCQQAQDAQGNQYWMKYVESAPLTVSRCPEGSIKEHQSNDSFGSMYPEMKGLIAPVPVRPVGPYHQLEYITSSNLTSDQQRADLLHYAEHSRTVPGPVFSVGCDYGNFSLGVNHPEVPETSLNLTTYYQERLPESICQELFSEFERSAFVPYKTSEFLDSPVLLNHCQQPQYHWSFLMSGVHSTLADTISSTVDDQGLSVPNILLPVNDQCAHFCQKASTAHYAYHYPPPVH